MGPRSLAVQMHQVSTCAGWAQHPTSREFYDAIRAEKPTDRQRSILLQWMQEARWDTIFAAWAEEVYTMRGLVQALHRAGLTETRWSRRLNRWAQIPEGEAGT